MKFFNPKQLLAIFLMLATLFSLSACGSTDHGDRNDEKKATTQPESSLSDDEVTSTLPAKPQPIVPSTTAKLGEFDTSATIDQTVLYDQSGISITATSLSYEYNYAVITFLFENNSDQDVEIMAGTYGYCCFAINNLMLDDGYISCDVLAGKKAKEDIEIDLDQLMFYGIDALSTIEIGFSIDDGKNETHTGPLKIKTSLAESHEKYTTAFVDRLQSAETMEEYEYSLKHLSKESLYADDEIEIVSNSILEDRNGDIHLLLEVKNNSGSEIAFETKGVTINGLCILDDNLWSSEEILPGHRAVIELDLYLILQQELWQAYDLQNIGSIQLNIAIGTDQTDTKKDATLNITVPNVVGSFDTTGLELYTSETTRIVYKGVVDSASEYDEDIYILLLVENKRDTQVFLDHEYNSFSLNDLMADCSFYTMGLAPGGYSAVVLHLYEYMLDDTDVTKASDIKNFGTEFSIITDHYKTLEEIKIDHTITE